LNEPGSHEFYVLAITLSTLQKYDSWPLHTIAKGHFHVIMRSMGFHPKVVSIVLTDMAYLLEVAMMEIPTNHETLFIVYHVGIHVDFSFMIILLGP
jgi:hypothetical protein